MLAQLFLPGPPRVAGDAGHVAPGDGQYMAKTITQHLATYIRTQYLGGHTDGTLLPLGGKIDAEGVTPIMSSACGSSTCVCPDPNPESSFQTPLAKPGDTHTHTTMAHTEVKATPVSHTHTPRKPLGTLLTGVQPPRAEQAVLGEAPGPQELPDDVNLRHDPVCRDGTVDKIGEGEG